MAKPTFIDLFAGIGGIRIAFESAGAECVLAVEYDRFAQDTYEAFFGHRPDFQELARTDPPGDIKQLPVHLVPTHDILTGGFPCQPFSLAGVSKKQSLGRPHGFEDPTQGTLFFNIKEILREKRPKAFLLENVKNLQSHDGGRTFRVIAESLHDLDYAVAYRTIDAAGWVPQHRERIYIVGFRRDLLPTYWEIMEFQKKLEELMPPNETEALGDILEAEVPDKYILGNGTWQTLKRHKRHHESIGQGFGYGLVERPFNGKVARTLSARYHKDGAEILISRGKRKRPRRLTPLECARLMGFPERYQHFFDRKSPSEQPVSDTQAYRQFGNSVVVPLVADIASLVVDELARLESL